MPSLSRAAGVSRFVYNMERYHDEKRVHYDFMHHAIRDGVYMHKKRYDEELKVRGCSVYPVNYAGDDLRRFMHEVHEVFEKLVLIMTLYIAICRTLRSVSFEKLNWSV